MITRYGRQIAAGRIPDSQRGVLVGRRVLPFGHPSLKIALSSEYGHLTFWQTALQAVADTGKCPPQHRPFMTEQEWVQYNRSTRRWELTAKGKAEL